MVKIDVAANADDLVAGVTAAVVVVVALADVVFDDDNIVVCVAVDVLLVADFVVAFVVVAVYDAGILSVVHVDA